MELTGDFNKNCFGGTVETKAWLEHKAEAAGTSAVEHPGTLSTDDLVFN